MKCPSCKIYLKETIFCNVGIKYCPNCLGLWFKEDDLRLAKDEKDEDLNWLDIDFWENKKDFRISRNDILCPCCEVPFYEVNYGDSEIKVDLCNVCHGVWLDRGEFKKIIDYLKKKARYEVMNNYVKNLLSETKEIFMGPEILKEELLDFLTILKILNYKLTARHPVILEIISNLPK